jgi:hypothetical protein
VNDLVDKLPWPSTPEDMHALLNVESFVKALDGFTHRSINGYIYSIVLEGGERGSFKGRVLFSDRYAARSGTIDGGGIPLLGTTGSRATAPRSST